MFKNIHYDSQNEIMHLWKEEDGESVYETINWIPYVYVPVKLDTGIKSIYGDDVARKNFSSYRDYKAYQLTHYDIHENKVAPTAQFLAENYHQFDAPVAPKLHIAFLDIECPHDDGFPTVEKTPAEVCLISIVDELSVITVFGIGPYTGQHKNIKYIKCSDEMGLLRRFFNWMGKQRFDVITGWNIVSDNKTNRHGGFDLPYLIRRCRKIFGKATNVYKRLSPINNVTIWKSKSLDGVYNVKVAGVTVMDYLALYKWFTTNNMESFKLDYVAEVELKKNKLDYSEYRTMWDFYKGNWNKFVDYCIIDSMIVKDLEDKLRYLKLAQTMTLLCCVPMSIYNSSVGLIEGVMLKYYRNNGLCAPYMAGGTQEHFPAAYVKQPITGLHKDVVDLDITSSYPTHQIIMNMSLETYYGRIIGFEEDHIIDFKTDKGFHEELHHGRPIYNTIVGYNRDKEYPPFHILKDIGITHCDGKNLKTFNKALKNNLICIAPCGSVFMNKPEGVYSKVVKETFFERKKQKGLKNDAKQKVREVETDEDKKYWNERADEKHVLQWSIKILINSFFGVTGVPYSRYFNPNISEAITSGGRHTIQMGEVFVNELLNEPDKTILSIVDQIKKDC